MQYCACRILDIEYDAQFRRYDPEVKKEWATLPSALSFTFKKGPESANGDKTYVLQWAHIR